MILTILAFYEFLCIIKVYSIGIPKSKEIQNVKPFWTQAFRQGIPNCIKICKKL
jgi:hypothetical protein